MWAKRFPAGVILGPLTLSAMLVSTQAAYADCSQAERTAGVCSSVSFGDDGDEVTISVSESEPGSSGSEQSSPSQQPSPSAPWTPPPIRQEAELGSSECQIKVQGLCRGAAPAKNPAQSDTTRTPPTPPRYASDLKSFRPDQPGLMVEPSGWSVPTLPTNMVAQARSHTVSGELLGWPVDVRFRPVAFHFDFGDGQGRSTTDSGSSWSSRGVPQFSATSTSHRYAIPGEYQVRLQVDYRVELRFDGGDFDDLEGFVSASAPAQYVEVLTVSPLLVDRRN